MTVKLDPEFKTRWVAALRSGRYHQGTGALCKSLPWTKLAEGGGWTTTDDKFYCCLGVGAAINDELHEQSDGYGADGTQWTVERGGSSYWYGPQGELDDDDAGMFEMPENWRESSTVTEYQPYVVLATMNDRGAPHAEIADWIEENL